MSERLPIKYGVSLFLRGRLTLSKLVFYLKNLGLTVISKNFSLLIPIFSNIIPPQNFTTLLSQFRCRFATYKSTTALVSCFRSNLNQRRSQSQPMSFNAFFKGWLLQSLPFGRQRKELLLHLTRIQEPQQMVWALPLLT